jgi:hypothetical protein
MTCEQWFDVLHKALEMFSLIALGIAIGCAGMWILLRWKP